MKKEETQIMDSIRVALSKAGCTVWRINVGTFYTLDGRKIKTGVPKGFSDLFGHTKDGHAFYIEIKTAIGKARKEQLNFIFQMHATGAYAGFARNEYQALEIIGEQHDRIIEILH